MAYSFNSDIVSDLHKDAYGFRPTVEFSILWELSSLDQKQEIWDDLIAIVERNIDAEEAAERKAAEAFEAQVAVMLQNGADSRETALRWIVESMELSEVELCYGGEHVCFLMGIPFTYRTELNAVVAEMQQETA